MSDGKIEMEIIWDRLQRGEYVRVDEKIYDYETGEFICLMSDLE